MSETHHFNGLTPPVWYYHGGLRAKGPRYSAKTPIISIGDILAPRAAKIANSTDFERAQCARSAHIFCRTKFDEKKNHPWKAEQIDRSILSRTEFNLK